jgi:hypothetical protein
MNYFERVEADLLDAVERRAARRAHPAGAVRERLSAARVWLGARPGLLALVGVLVLSGSAAGSVLLAGEPSRSLSGVVPPYNARGNVSVAGSHYAISITPSLQAGTIGWCNSIVFRGVRELHGGRAGGFGSGSCGAGTAGVGSPLFAPDGGRGGGVWYVLTTPQVAAVRITGGPTVLTRGAAQLPFGFRAAVAGLPPRAFADGAPQATALAADGHAIPGGAYEPPPPQESVAYWVAPHRPPRGACALAARPGAGVRVTQGSVVTTVVPDPGILGRAYLSCAEVEVSVGGASLAAAVLLDAQHPGSPPAALPDMRPVPGAPGVFTRASPLGLGRSRTILARRAGAAWLVVAGAASARQGLRALRALTAGPLDLRPPRGAPRAPADAECAIAVRPLAGLQEVSQDNYLIHGRAGHPLPRGGAAELTTCAQAGFYLRKWPLAATVLFPIGRPGVPPLLRHRQPVPGHSGVFTIPAEVGGDRSAVRRVGRVWVELQGGGLERQLAVLGRVRVTVARARRPVQGGFAPDMFLLRAGGLL